MPTLALSTSAKGPVLWATATMGEELETTDTGHSWTVVNPASGLIGGDAFGASFAGQAGWLATGSALYETTDGGATWHALPSLPSPPHEHVVLSWLQRVSATAGWGVTDYDVLEKSVDQGTTWSVVGTPAQRIEAACFASATKGLVATDQPTPAVYMTSDGDATWTQVFSYAHAAYGGASLSCDRTTDATLELVFSKSTQGRLEETWAPVDGWSGSWTAVAGNDLPATGTSPPPVVDKIADAQPDPAVVTVTGDVVTSMLAGNTVDLGTGRVSKGHIGAVRTTQLGSLDGASRVGIPAGQAAHGVLFTSPSTGYAFASSATNHTVLLSITHTGGSSWATTTTSLPVRKP